MELTKIAGTFRNDTPVGLAARRREWSARLGAAREAIDGAEVDFLHEVHRSAGEETLSLDRYLGLVHALRARRRAILRAALAPAHGRAARAR